MPTHNETDETEEEEDEDLLQLQPEIPINQRLFIPDYPTTASAAHIIDNHYPRLMPNYSSTSNNVTPVSPLDGSKLLLMNVLSPPLDQLPSSPPLTPSNTPTLTPTASQPQPQLQYRQALQQLTLKVSKLEHENDTLKSTLQDYQSIKEANAQLLSQINTYTSHLEDIQKTDKIIQEEKKQIQKSRIFRPNIHSIKKHENEIFEKNEEINKLKDMVHTLNTEVHTLFQKNKKYLIEIELLKKQKYFILENLSTAALPQPPQVTPLHSDAVIVIL